MAESSKHHQDSSGTCCGCDGCKAFCLRICCCCCKDLGKEETDKYPHVVYGQLPQQTETKQSYSRQVSKESYSSTGNRYYKYPQKYREYNLPPQLAESDDEVDLVVREQPRAIYEHQHTDSQSYPSSESYRSGSAADGRGREEEEEEEYYDDDYDDDIDDDPGYIPSGRNPSIIQIERSPESTLKRGEHIEFPTSSKKMSLNTIRPLRKTLLKKLEELKPATSPAVAGVHFSLYFDETKSMLILHVNKAVNLPTQRPAETCNPFLQTYLLPSKTDVQQSHCVDGTHSPIFDRVFRFVNLNIDNLRRHVLIMRFYINVNHFVGGILYPLEDANMCGDKEVMEIAAFDEDMGLRESFQGDILITICYHSKTSILEILIIEVSNLKKHDILRLPNPYAKINLIYRGQRLSKWKTSTKKSTTNPIFSEACEIDISTMNVEDVQFDVVVMNYDRLGHNNEIGSVSFGDIVSHQSGQEHWKKVMISTNTEVTQWHPLVKSQQSPSRSPSPSPKHQTATPMKACFGMTPSGMQF